MRSSARVSLAGAADGAAWEAYVDSRRDAAGYHSWRWRSVFENAFGHEPVYLLARHGGVIAGVLPMVQIKSVLFGRTLTSLPEAVFNARSTPASAPCMSPRSRRISEVSACASTAMKGASAADDTCSARWAELSAFAR